MENAKRSLGFLHHYYGSPIPFFQMAAVGRVVSLGYGYQLLSVGVVVLSLIGEKQGVKRNCF